MPRRFFCTFADDSDEVLLAGPEAHHLLHVLRLGRGDEAVLFDGRGTEALARVESVEKANATLRILERRPSQTETPVPIVLATAVPKGDRFAWLIEKATELGVQRVVPLLTQRSIVNPGAGKLDKLRQSVIAASKQCGRSQLLQIEEPLGWEPFLRGTATSGRLLVAHPSGAPLPAAPEFADQAILLAIGPEGGFTDEELAAATRVGARLVGLGPRILRIETAALALVTLVAGRLME